MWIDDNAGYNGMTVRQVLSVANTALGGGAAAYNIDDIAALTASLFSAFEGGTVSQFAQDHLVDGPCPQRWHDGDVITYGQDSWGGDPSMSTAAALLLAQFDAVYAGAAVEVGISGAAGFSMAVTSAAAILNYLPANGGNAPLNADFLDPLSTSSGAFGGFVLALQLDVDFSDAGQLGGSVGPCVR